MINKISVLAGYLANALPEACDRAGRAAKGVFLAAIAACLLAGISPAATFTVTTAADTGTGSLRQAVIDANNAPGADTINFGPNLQQGGFTTINLASELTITSDITIDGPKTTDLYVFGNLNTRLFNISGANVEIRDLSLYRGSVVSPISGGGILITGGTTTLNRVTIWDCRAGNGGGVYVQNGNLIVNNSTFTANSAVFNGGALLVANQPSTITITSSTFNGNLGSQSGGAISIQGGTVNARNSIFANSSSNSGPEISGTLVSQGYNLIETISGATITGTTTGNQLNIDPQLLGIGLNGGGSRTLALATSSPAIDAGDPSLAATTDQRAAVRGGDGNGNGQNGVDIGAYERQRPSFDFDGDGTADLSVTRVPSSSLAEAEREFAGLPLSWFYGGRGNSFHAGFSPRFDAVYGQQFGLDDDIAVPADYDGDGRTDAAVFRPSSGDWYINATTSGFRGLHWGLSGDIPVPADYDGDGKADISVYRAGVWYILKSQFGYTGAIVLGNLNSKPVPADFDGDGKADIAVYEGGTWTILRSTAGPTSQQFGLATDIPVANDYNGDGMDEAAVFRPGTGTWYMSQANGSFAAIQFGLATDKLIPADYDGDGKTDIGVRRVNGTTLRGDWYILQSRDGFVLSNFGFGTDRPVASSYIAQ